MDLAEAINTLRQHNDWRTDRRPVPDMIEPRAVTEAIDTVCELVPMMLEALQELRYACTDKAERLADAAIAKAQDRPERV